MNIVKLEGGSGRKTRSGGVRKITNGNVITPGKFLTAVGGSYIIAEAANQSGGPGEDPLVKKLMDLFFGDDGLPPMFS